MLRDLMQNLSFLLVVVNGVLSENGREQLLTITPNILVRPNVDLDVGAWKDGLEYIRWDHLTEYDEIVMTNQTLFGPVYPLKETFDAMNSRDIDFWGLTKFYGPTTDYAYAKKCKYGFFPTHIQASFIAVRKSMFLSSDFRQHWDNMPTLMVDPYWGNICYHEAIFTKYFEDKGYKSDVYVNTDDLASYHEYPLFFYALELVKNRRCPVFKRKSFFGPFERYMNTNYGQSAWELYEFIKAETNYDVGMIWENLLRTTNMYDIKNQMHLNYILPTVNNLSAEHSAKTALFMHLNDLSMMDTLRKYAGNMPADTNIIIATSSEEKKEKINQAFSTVNCHELRVIVISDRGRDVSALLIGLKAYVCDYDYICFIHDMPANNEAWNIKGESFAYKCYENVLSGKAFVENVITTFHENPHLGLLVPPPPNHGEYYSLVGDSWCSNYSNTKELADKLDIHVDIDPNKAPIAPLGACFWFRSKALQPLFDYNFTYDDFPLEPLQQRDGTILDAITRLYPFVAQNEGYYTGWLMSDVFSNYEVTNLYKQLRDCYQTLFRKFGKQQSHQDLLNCFTNNV